MSWVSARGGDVPWGTISREVVFLAALVFRRKTFLGVSQAATSMSLPKEPGELAKPQLL